MPVKSSLGDVTETASMFIQSMVQAWAVFIYSTKLDKKVHHPKCPAATNMIHCVSGWATFTFLNIVPCFMFCTMHQCFQQKHISLTFILSLEQSCSSGFKLTQSLFWRTSLVWRPTGTWGSPPPSSSGAGPSHPWLQLVVGLFYLCTAGRPGLYLYSA